MGEGICRFDSIAKHTAIQSTVLCERGDELTKNLPTTTWVTVSLILGYPKIELFIVLVLFDMSILEVPRFKTKPSVWG